MQTNSASIRRRAAACALLAVALWLAADPAMAQESIIAPVGEQFYSWISVFETDLYPVAVTAGLLIGIALCAFVSLKIGIFAVCGVVAAALLWGARDAIVNLGT